MIDCVICDEPNCVVEQTEVYRNTINGVSYELESCFCLCTKCGSEFLTAEQHNSFIYTKRKLESSITGE